jgi:hypothetical protein
MRKWWRELPPGLKVVVIGVLAFATYLGMNLLLFRDRFGDALFSALLYTLLIAGGLHFTQKRFRRTKARLDEHGQSLMFLRYPNARPGSLSGVWQMGIASPTAGRIDFQPAVYDELIPSGRSRGLTGLQATGMPPRIASRNDTKQAVPFGFQIITLDSDGGVIEIAASPATLKKIQDAVEPASP